MKTIFLFLLPASLFMIGLPLLVNAQPFPNIEYGKNFDRQYLGMNENGMGIFNYGTVPERILDYVDEKGQMYYVNYKTREDSTNVYFESAKGSYIFKKDTCTFEMYEGGKLQNNDEKITLSHTIKEALNGTDTWYLASENNKECSYSLSDQNGIVQIIAIKGDFKTIYDINYAKGFEWTYKYKNTDTTKTDHKYGFTFVCEGNNCDDITIDNQTFSEPIKLKTDLIGKTIKLGDKVFDPKNEQHDYLWALKKQNDKMIVDFTHSKGRLEVGDELIVDPTFSVAGTSSARLITTSTNAAACSNVYSSNNANFFIYQPLEGTNDECQYAVTQFNIASLAGQTIVVTSAFIELDVDVEDNTKDCQVRRLTTDLSTINQQDLTDTQGGKVLVSSDADCNTTGNNKALNFGTNMTDIATAVSASVTNYAVGISCPPAWDRPSSGGRCNFEFSDPSLNFTYVGSPPSAPLTLTGVSQARKVQFDWTISSGSGVTGYYIGRSLDNSTWPSANKTLVGNVTTYLDTSYWRINQLYYVNITATNGINSTAKFSSFTTDNFPSAPQNTQTTSMSSSTIKLNWSPPSSNGNDPITQYRIEACLICSSWTLLSNNTSTFNYNHTGLFSGQTWKYRMAAWNGVALGTYSANFTGQTYQSTTAVLPMNTTMVGDAFGVTPKLRMTAGNPPATITSSQLYRNGTLIDTDTYSQSISNGQTKILSNQFTNLLNRNFIYNHTVIISITNGSGSTQTFSNSTYERPDYTANYYTMNGYEVNYTQFRSGAGSQLNLTINRDPVPFHISCYYKSQLFENGTLVERDDAGYYNVLQSVPRTQNVYVKCYNDALIVDFVSYGQFNGTLAILDYSEELGTFFGVPIIFMPIIFFAALFTGVSAPRGAIFLVAVIGIMGVMGFFPDGNGDPLITGATWSLLIFLAVTGLFIGKRWS